MVAGLLRPAVKRLTFERQDGFCYSLDASADPTLTIEAGERVLVETEDAYLGQISEPGDARDREAQPKSNPLSGPISVEGAEPGDALAVTVQGIAPKRGQASTYVPSWWTYAGTLGDREAVESFLGVDLPNPATVLPIDGETVRFGDGVELTYAPMIGTIATAPAAGSAPHGTAGPHGGNMDLPCLAPGSRITLPVEGEGAKLYVGDAHALQGDGEITFVGAEMAAEIELTIDLEPGAAPPWPRIETEDHLYVVTAKTAYSDFADAIRLAYVHLATWLTEFGLDRWDAWQLCALNGVLRIGNLHCVAAGYPRRDLPDR